MRYLPQHSKSLAQIDDGNLRLQVHLRRTFELILGIPKITHYLINL